jgi:hypothetical protein
MTAIASGSSVNTYVGVVLFAGCSRPFLSIERQEDLGLNEKHLSHPVNAGGKQCRKDVPLMIPRIMPATA